MKGAPLRLITLPRCSYNMVCRIFAAVTSNCYACAARWCHPW